MKRSVRFGRLCAALVLMGLAALTGSGSRAWAQYCGGSITTRFLRPLSGATNLGGACRIDLGLTEFPADWSLWWYNAWVDITDSSGNLVEEGVMSIVTGGEACYVWQTSILPNGTYTLTAQAIIYDDESPYCNTRPVSVTVTVANPCSARHSSR